MVQIKKPSLGSSPNIGQNMRSALMKSPRRGRSGDRGSRMRDSNDNGDFKMNDINRRLRSIRSRSGSGGRSRSDNDDRRRRRRRSRSSDGKSKNNNNGPAADNNIGGRTTPRGQRKDALMMNYDEYESNRGSVAYDDDDGEGATLSDTEGGGRNNKRSRGWLPTGGISRSRSYSHSPSSGRRNKRRQLPYFHRSNYFTNTNRHRSRNNNNNNDEEMGEILFPSRYNSHLHKHSPTLNYTWILPPHLKLAPRIDIWLTFAISSCVAVASIGQIHQASMTTATNYDGIGDENVGKFTPPDMFALSTCVISFILSLFVAIGMRYAPLRTAITKSLWAPASHDSSSRRRRNNGLNLLLGSLNLTVELLVLTFLFIFWMVSMPIVVNGDAYYTANKEVALAMAGSDIWNANLFYSAWSSFILCTYLWIEVITLSDRGGTIKAARSSSRDCSSSTSPSPSSTSSNTFSKRWTFLAITSIVLFSSSISIYSSPSCSGTLLRQTSYCSRALGGTLVGGLLQFLIVGAVGVMYGLSSTSHYNQGTTSAQRTPILAVHKRNSGAGMASVLSFIVQSINAGLLTSPTGGGPGNVSGTLYFASWMGFVLVFELCLRYLESFRTGDGSRKISSNSRGGTRRINLENDVTVFEEDDEQEESILMLRNGSEHSSRSSNRSRGGSTISSRTRHREFANKGVEVECEDSSDEDQAGDVGNIDMDTESFVFSCAEADAKSKASRRSKGWYGGIDPDESSFVNPQRRGSDPDEFQLGGSSGNVGYIDVRSATQRSRSGDEASAGNKNNRAEPDGVLKKQQSVHRDDFDLADIDMDSGDYADEDLLFGAAATMEPQGIMPSFTNFHMDQVEKLDDVPSKPHDPSPHDNIHPHRQHHNESPLMRMSTQSSGKLSPLEEGSGEEISPNTDSISAADGSSGIEDYTPQRQVGDNLRTMQAMRMHQQAQAAAAAVDRPKSRPSHSKKSATSRSSRSHSREKRLNKVVSGIHSSVGGSTPGGHVSRHSTSASTKSRRSRPTGSRKSDSLSSMTHGSGILTEDEEDSSGSNPPPTISDGISAKDDLSGFSAMLDKSNKSGSRSNSSSRGAAAAPFGIPPPPFGLSSDQASVQSSHYSDGAPMRSIHNHKSNEEDSIVSDPTLDSGLASMPSQQVRPKLKTPPIRHSSSETNSYDKKYSDETEMKTLSDPSNPSSEEGDSGNMVVDNIVAAALAYAEKTHSVSGTSGSNTLPPKSKSFSHSTQKPRASAANESSSIHSFYSESEMRSQKGGGGGDKSHSTGNPHFASKATSAGVEDLVAKALFHAQSQIDHSSQQQQPDTVPETRFQKSEFDVGSMYSEDTDFSNPDAGVHFDC